MGKCDEIRELYNNCKSSNIQTVFDLFIEILEKKIREGSAGKTMTIAVEDIEKFTHITNVYLLIPQLRKKFENEGFSFKYSSAIHAGDESYIMISGWAD